MLKQQYKQTNVCITGLPSSTLCSIKANLYNKYCVWTEPGSCFSASNTVSLAYKHENKTKTRIYNSMYYMDSNIKQEQWLFKMFFKVIWSHLCATCLIRTVI